MIFLSRKRCTSSAKSFRHAHERSAVTEQPRVVVTAADTLYRLVSPDYVEPDGQVNLFAFCYRKSRKPDPAISVDLARLISKVDDTLTRSKVEGTRIGELSASVPMAMR